MAAFGEQALPALPVDGDIVDAWQLPVAYTDRHPILRARADAELPQIAQVRLVSAPRTWLVGWQPEATVGAEALGRTDRPHRGGKPIMLPTTGASVTPAGRRAKGEVR